nr:hypothetical protein [Streptomyces sp. JV178]
MAGEICVGGAGVALGHLGQEGLTARRFGAVAVHRDDPSDAATARIDAYVALSPGGDPVTVRERAANILPEYMLPATVNGPRRRLLRTGRRLPARRPQRRRPTRPWPALPPAS